MSTVQTRLTMLPLTRCSRVMCVNALIRYPLMFSSNNRVHNNFKNNFNLMNIKPAINLTAIISCRCQSTTSSNDSAAESLFETMAEETLEQLNDTIEDIMSTHAPSFDYDISLSSGVLTINLDKKGIYVINKQTPNRQIWLSSPISGPKRYDLKGNKWIYNKDASSLDELLSREFSETFNADIKLDLNRRR